MGRLKVAKAIARTIEEKKSLLTNMSAAKEVVEGIVERRNKTNLPFDPTKFLEKQKKDEENIIGEIMELYEKLAEVILK